MNPAFFRCLGLAAALVLPLSGNVTVTTAADENNGSLDPGQGAGTSLREAVAFAPAGSVIDFAPGLSGHTITLGGGQISFGRNLTLDASALAGGVTVSGNDASRVFDIPSSRLVAMTRMKIVHGDTSGDGGGIRSAGTLSLTDCELSANHADDGGGAIESSGPLTATACTFAGNTAGVGGGAIEHTASTLTLINCTLTGNTADFGGAIDGDGSSTIQLRSCTVSGNHATNDGGGIEETTGTLVLENTIVAGNTADDEGDDLKASGINTETGKNLVSSTAGLGGSFSGIVADPLLSPLGNHGGVTRTMPPLAGSPAINAGGSTTLTVDQRGLPRVVGTAVDIGAVEDYGGVAITGQVDVLALLDLGQAVVTTAPLDNGPPEDVFDGDLGSLIRSANVDPAWVQVSFATARTMTRFRASFSSGGPYHWKVEMADTQADMDGQSGTWAELFPWQTVQGDDLLHEVELTAPATAKIFKLVVMRDTDDYVHINEWELHGPVILESVELVPIAPDEGAITTLELTHPASRSYRCFGRDQDGGWHDITGEAAWTSTHPAIATAAGGGVVTTVAPGETAIHAGIGTLEDHFDLSVRASGSADDDISVAWIQRLPVIDYAPNSPQPATEGWPAAGSTVTWRAMVKNWSTEPRANVCYRWLLDGTVHSSGAIDLPAGGYAAVELPWIWSFARHGLTFELDPLNAVAEFSEANNVLQTWTDAITVGFWVEQSVYDYMHHHQQDLGVGSNGFEDWAQRQVKLWNDQFAAAVHPVDAPLGVLDRVRIDKITLVPDHSLPLNGGPPSNQPDQFDRSVDLMWGFHAWTPCAGGVKGYLEDKAFHSPAAMTTVSEENPFYRDWVTFHEVGHARYLADVSSFNVNSRFDLLHVGAETGSRIDLTLGGQTVEGTRYMPRVFWDHVFYAHGNESMSPFHGLMHADYTKLDRYSAMALNRIAGHRAILGNYNVPGNSKVFLDDLPDQNTVQLSDGHGNLLAGAGVLLYRGVRGTFGKYSKVYDDVPDGSRVADEFGRVEVGRNPFTDGTPVAREGVEVIILRADAGGKTGYGFLPVGLFNMEFWRGNTGHGRHELSLAMIGPDPEIARVLAWKVGAGDRRLQIVLGGTTEPTSVTVDGEAAIKEYDDGAWWVTVPDTASPTSEVVAVWPGGPTLTQTVFLDEPVVVPQLFPEKIPAGLRVGWWSRAGYRYQAGHSENLIDWTPTGTIHFGTGGWMEADDPGAGPRGFTRLEASRLTD